jgi:acyl carrier protein
MTSNIANTIESFIVEEIMMVGKEIKIDPESSLIKSGIVDSLSLLRLISFLEEKFGIVIDDEDVVPENFDTIKIMESLVAEKI